MLQNRVLEAPENNIEAAFETQQCPISHRIVRGISWIIFSTLCFLLAITTIVLMLSSRDLTP